MRLTVIPFAFVFLLGPQSAFSQLSIPRFEAGLTFSCISSCGDDVNTGFGGRGTVNITNVVAGEFQVTRLSRPNEFIDPIVYGNGQAKFTIRLEDRMKFNVFGFGGPGFSRFDRFVVRAPNTAIQRFTGPTFSLGGGFEVVPVRFMSVRLDVAYLKIKNQCTDLSCDQREYTDNGDFKIGVMFRFP